MGTSCLHSSCRHAKAAAEVLEEVAWAEQPAN